MKTHVAVSFTSESSDHYIVLAEIENPEDLFDECEEALGDELAWCYIKAHTALGQVNLAHAAIKHLHEKLDKLERD